MSRLSGIIYWKGVSDAYREATGLCISDSEARAIAKLLNAQLEAAQK